MLTQDRIDLSKRKVGSIVDALVTLQQVRENNELILYSDLLSKQVGKSYAAHSFNIVQACLFESEVVRVCALWDPAGGERQARDRDSIPAVAWLVSDEAIEALGAALIDDRCRKEFVQLNPPLDPKEADYQTAALGRIREKRARDEASELMKRLKAVRERIAEIECSDLQTGLRRFRDQYVAHALASRAGDSKVEVVTPKYGDEKKLFEQSIEVIKELYYGVCDSSYGWDMAGEHSRRYASALLSKCQLNILE